MKVERMGPVVDERLIEVWVSERVQFKMTEYVRQCATEIAWMGLVTQRHDVETGMHTFRIEDVMLAPQEVSSATADFIDEEFGQWALDFASNHAEGEDVLDRLLFWGHSHVNMGVIPSGTDLETLLSFDDGRLEVFIAAILNKKGECRYDVAFYRDGLKFCDVPVIQEHRWHELSHELQAEITANVTTKTYIKPSKVTNLNTGNKKKKRKTVIEREDGVTDVDTYTIDNHGNYRDAVTGKILIGTDEIETLRDEMNYTIQEIDELIYEQVQSGAFNFQDY